MIKSMLSFLFCCTWLLAQQAEDALALESRTRHERNIQEGYNLTYGLTLRSKPLRVEFLVPPHRSAHRLNLWLKTQGGEANVRLRCEDAAEVFAWSGREGELTLVCQLPVGKYTLEITSPQGGRAEFAMKGPQMEVCDLDAERCAERPADPAQGFRWPYLLYTPKEVKVPFLLVVPNNTGFAVENLDLIRASGRCELQRQRALADRLGCPLLVPLFPRPILDPKDTDEGNLYLHALSREALLAELPEWRRVDLQLLGMIDDARALLTAQGRAVQPRILLSGFSASGMFVNRFGLLHPERVLGVACGSPGGWPIAPVETVSGERLPYPVGSADLAALGGRPLDLEALRKVNWFFYLGAEDRNDAVVCRDSFAKSDEELIFRRFGPTLQDRWRKAEQLYTAQSLSATFRLYAKAAHVVNDPMAEDIARFFEGQMRRSVGQH